MPDIKAIKRHSKRMRIHIYSKIIYNHFLRSSHKKKTPGDPVSSLFGPKPLSAEESNGWNSLS